MTASVTKVGKEPLKRVNTRITAAQDAFIKKEVEKSRGEMTEGDVHRMLLAKGIISHKLGT